MGKIIRLNKMPILMEDGPSYISLTQDPEMKPSVI